MGPKKARKGARKVARKAARKKVRLHCDPQRRPLVDGEGGRLPRHHERHEGGDVRRAQPQEAGGRVEVVRREHLDGHPLAAVLQRHRLLKFRDCKLIKLTKLQNT